MAKPTWEPKTAVEKTTIHKYRGKPRQWRMEEAVRLHMEDGVSQSEAARMCGVSRSKVNVRVGEAKKMLAAQAERAAASLDEKRILGTTVSGVSDVSMPTQGGPGADCVDADTGRPVQPYITQERRVPTFREFNELYFSNEVCPDCGVHHETPEFHGQIMDLLEDRSKRMKLCNLAPYHKLDLLTPILTDMGWSTMGDLEAGDRVFSMDGTLTVVLGVSEVMVHDTYRVTFDDGAEIIADADHRWWIDPASPGMAPRFMTTAEIVEKGTHFPSGAARWRVPVAEPLDYPEADLPLDPYCLGAWLGDGVASGPDTFWSADPEIPARFELAGFPTKRRDREHCWSVKGLPKSLRAAGVPQNDRYVFTKMIPERYMRASYKQRLSLMQGLMDTDGTVSPKGRCCFTQNPGPLMEQFIELARGLGLKPHYREELRPDGGPIGRCEFTTNVEVFGLGRKLERVRRFNRDRQQAPAFAHRRITGVERIEDRPGKCIKVAHPSETFLAGRELIPTGNSKSTIATVKSTLYELVRDPSSRTAIISQASDLAKAFLYQIKQHLQDPDLYNGAARNLIEDWGPFYNPNSWAADQIYIYGRSGAQKDPSVSTYGFGTQIYGRRFDRMIFDDVATLDNQNTSDSVAKMYRKIWQEYVNRVGKTGQLIFVGTRVAAGDIYSMLDDVDGMNVLRFPCIIDEDTEQMLWEEHFPFKSAVEQRAAMSLEQFQLVYQNVETMGANASFSPEMVAAAKERGKDRAIGQYDPSWALVAGLDPAGANDQAGFTSMVLLGLDTKTGMRHLIDLVNVKQMKAPDILGQIYAWAEQYPLRELRVEVNGLQSQLYQYNRELNERLVNRGVRLVPHITHGRNKWDPNFGVESMASMFHNGLITLPHLDVNSRAKVRFLEDQLLGFPMKKPDDLVMAMWFASLGVREMAQRTALPSFDPRRKVPGRIARNRRVVNFGDKEMRQPTHFELTGQLEPSPQELTKLANIDSSVMLRG